MIRENAFKQKKKKPGLKFNPGLALIGLWTTGPRILMCCIGNIRNTFLYNLLSHWKPRRIIVLGFKWLSKLQKSVLNFTATWLTKWKWLFTRLIMVHTQLLVHRFQCCFADRLNQKFISLCGKGNRFLWYKAKKLFFIGFISGFYPLTLK